ncbi:hypothetical protein [Streptomyces sp. NPDC089799]|uniref:hypothetical protein n=1 Tax=Streptomyces sp. NPDC089799 TaxID=3155066 RepID=UPI0034191D88
MKPIRPLALAATAAAVLLLTGATTATALDDPPKPAWPGGSGNAATLSPHPYYWGPTVAIPAGGFAYVRTDCPSGWVPTGGGGRTSSTLTFITDSAPDNTGWVIGVKNTSTAEASAYAYAVCTVP